MPVEIRLKKILQQYGLDKKGIIQTIAEEVGVHRHSIGKLYRNEYSHPSLDVEQYLFFHWNGCAVHDVYHYADLVYICQGLSSSPNGSPPNSTRVRSAGRSQTSDSVLV